MIETSTPPTSASTRIDVREIAAHARHGTIFAAFRALALGEALEIVNDHDPQPLYRQLQAEAPGDFSWSYLQFGPVVWRVSVQKLAQPHSAGNCCGMCGGNA